MARFLDRRGECAAERSVELSSQVAAVTSTEEGRDGAIRITVSLDNGADPSLDLPL